MKQILSTLVLMHAFSPAFAGHEGFGLGGPDCCIWAEIRARPTCIAGRPSASPAARMERNV